MLDVFSGQARFASRIRLVIADPQPIVLQGLKSVFATQQDFEIVALCGCGTSCLEAIRNFAPDAALVASTLPDLAVSELLAIAKGENLVTRLMFFADIKGDDDLIAAIAAGSCHAISTYADPGAILRSLRLATEDIGGAPRRSNDVLPTENDADSAKIEKMLRVLTQRERQIVQLVSEGLSNKEIARELNVSRGTVKVHLYNIFQKLEINNRTVLATIALQRSTGFTTLSLALAVAILSDADPSEAGDFRPGEPASKDIQHSGLDGRKQPVLRHAVSADPDSAVTLASKGSFIRENQATPLAARMEGPSAATAQAAMSHQARVYSPVGSSAFPSSISASLQTLNNSQAGTPTALQQLMLPAFASNPISVPANFINFAVAAAGLGLYVLDHAHAEEASRQGETLIGATAAIEDGATQMATFDSHFAGKGDPAALDSLASAPVAQDPPSHFALETFHGGAAEAFASRTVHDALRDNKPVKFVYGGTGSDTIDGHAGDDTVGAGSGDAAMGASGGEGAPGSRGGDSHARPPADSKLSRSNSSIDFTSGADRINLAAFGALAFLQLTSASQSVPPHTLAWIYDPVSNQTIVYVNATDHSLDIGDAGLLEFHLQGVVSTAEVDSAHEPDAAAIAAALQGIDPELLAAVSDGTVLTADTVDFSLETMAGEHTSGTAAGWTMPADDGLRFHFGLERINANVSTRLVSFDSAVNGAEGRDVGSSNIPVHLSPIELANSGASAQTDEKFAAKNGSLNANLGAETIGHGNPHASAGLLFDVNMQSTEIVTPVVAEETSNPGNGQNHDSSGHASQSHGAKGADAVDLADDDQSNSGVAHGKSEHASKAAVEETPADAALNEPDDAPSHGNSQHPAHPAAAEASSDMKSTEPAYKTGHGNSKHESKSAAVETPAPELDKSGDASGQGNSQHPSHPSPSNASSQVESTDSVGANGHAHSEPSSNSSSVKALVADKSAVPDSTLDGVVDNGWHASNPASTDPRAVALQPNEPTSGTVGAAPEHAFHFKKQAPSSSPAAVVDLAAVHEPPVDGAEPTAILETGQAIFDGEGTGHVQHGQHHAVAHFPHDLMP